MLRNSWILGLGLFAIASTARANDLIGANDTVPVNWGHFGRGCSNCGSGYYAPNSGYGYYGATNYSYGSSSYGYGYVPSYWGSWSAAYAPAYPAPSGYWGAAAAPAGYWAGYAANYHYGWASPYSYAYGYGAGYPAAYGYGYGYVHPYAPAYYAPMSYSTCCAPAAAYYQPAATWAMPYAYATPPVVNVFVATARTAAYPQAAPMAGAPQMAPQVAPYPAVAPRDPGYDYNGGPANPIPMPRLEPQPAPNSAPVLYNIRLAQDDKAPASKYAFKAYGEKGSKTTVTQDNTVLVKDVK